MLSLLTRTLFAVLVKKKEKQRNSPKDQSLEKNANNLATFRFSSPFFRGGADGEGVRDGERGSIFMWKSRGGFSQGGGGRLGGRVGGKMRFGGNNPDILFWAILPRFFFSPGEAEPFVLQFCGLSGPLNRSNAILSLLQPLDRFRTPSAIGSAIGRPLSRPISHPNTGGNPQPPRSKPLSGLNRAIVAL